MFPLQQSGELCFSFKVASNSSSHHPLQQHGVPQDFVFLDHGDRREPSTESKDTVAAYGTEETRCRKTHAVHNKNENAVDEEGERKKKHREIEKQRRREMASLYAALRSLLPIEYGKVIEHNISFLQVHLKKKNLTSWFLCENIWRRC